MSMAVSSDDVIIPLRGGASISLELITWLLDAEDRGIRFATQPDGRVRMSPPDRVTVADVSFARAHRDEVRAAVAYCEQMLEMPS
jgi:hypothetical protein